ncbi:MAG: beta-lactamase family protein [Anaerolineales bacterium]|nr:beta-lactamase family protein [Anaerolineales bacterium]
MQTNQQKKWDALCEVVEETMAAKKVPGVALGVWHQGEMAVAGFGVTNVNHPLPVTPDTLFQVGSITKTFTGTAVMRLVEAGQLNLDATVRHYLPDFRVADAEASANATVRHLLTHTGGWVGDFFHGTGNGADALPRYVADMAGLEQLAPLGTVWSYNNAGFGVAGAIIEKVTGQLYEDALRELVLEPLKLSHSYLYPGDVMVHRFVVGHKLDGDALQVAVPWPLPRYSYPIGGIVCRAEDLLHYARFHLGDGRAPDGARLLTKESLAAMQTPQAAIWDKESRGLTWGLDDTYGPRLVEHGGGTKGQVSRLTLVPQHDFALVVLTNAEHGGAVWQAARRAALQSYLGMDAAPPTPLDAGADELAGFGGWYGRPYADIELGLLGGRLTAQMRYKGSFPTEDVPIPPPPPPFTLDLCAPDRLIGINGPMKDALVDVIRQPDGTIGWLRVGGRLYRRGE